MLPLPIPVLIVDDDPTVGVVLRGLLRNLGDGVRCAPKWVGSAAAALEQARTGEWVLMLLDYHLGDGDGLSVLEAVNALPIRRRPTVIMLTGSGNEQVAVEAMKRGAKDYLVKSGVHLPELRRAILGALERRLLEDRLAESTEELRQKNAQLEADLAMARQVQEALLPHQYPTFPADVPTECSRLRFAHRWIPSHAVAGDFFTVLPLASTRAAVLVCDVMGHGVRAALVTALIHGLVRECLGSAADPARFLTEVNRGLQALLARSGELVFVTAVYLVIDMEHGELRFANAGHPRPLLQRRGEGVCELPVGRGGCGPALGLLPDELYEAAAVPLRAGDRVVLFTDGVCEATDRNDGEFGTERLCAAIARHGEGSTPELLDALVAELREFRAPREGFADDLCLVGVDFMPPGGG